MRKLLNFPKRLGNKIRNAILKLFLSRVPLSVLAPLIQRMAQTGEGTDACLELGCLPVLVHYYSPIPDIKDLEERNIWNTKSDLAGINFRKDEQIKLLLKLGNQFGSECVWPLSKTNDANQFYLVNNSFSYGCASSLHSMIRYNKPRRIIEIGSGHSSKVISAAISKNLAENNQAKIEYYIVDPYPDETYIPALPHLTNINKQRVELVDPVFFNQLGENDILFIDSSHSVKIGSDVNYLILQILPKLAPGVIVHLHDIPMPYEYSKAYATNPAFRMFWTESYLLQAFLSLNHDYEIQLAMSYLMNDHMDVFCEAFSKFEIKDNWATSGSIWIKRVNA